MTDGITSIRSRTAILNRSDIDTDQIIPARFLTTTSRQGLGKHAFADWRYREDGTPNPDFELNHANNRDASVLVAGRNFGCGSSREHAPWSLLDYGFRAVVSSEIADIFRSNSLKNGLIPIVVGADMHQQLLSRQHDVVVDLESTSITIVEGDQAIARETFSIDHFSRYCIMKGTDQLGYLMSHMDAIEKFERTRGDAAT